VACGQKLANEFRAKADHRLLSAQNVTLRFPAEQPTCLHRVDDFNDGIDTGVGIGRNPFAKLTILQHTALRHHSKGHAIDDGQTWIAGQDPGL
jgi:hypothetical protein